VIPADRSVCRARNPSLQLSYSAACDNRNPLLQPASSAAGLPSEKA
jgi:hypothetical protein